MKILCSLLLMLSLMASCAHKNKKDQSKAGEDYTPEVSFIENDTSYSAKLYLPEKFKEKLPLVIIVHEWWGRTEYIENRAQMLAKEGFAALPVDLYGNGKTVTTPTEAKAMATPFYQNPERAVELLVRYIELAKKDPHVNAEKIFVIGYCFGGTQALNLARSGVDIQGVASFHGGLTSTYPTAKEIKAPILVLHGAADPMVPPKDVKEFEREMKKAKASYEVIHYPGATHAFTNPKATEIGKKYNIPIAYNKSADKKSWEALLKFLRR